MKRISLCLLVRPPLLRPVLFYITALIAFVILWIVLALEYRSMRQRYQIEENPLELKACTKKHLSMIQVSLWNTCGHFFMGIAVVLYTYGMCSTNITKLGFIEMRTTRGPLLLVVLVYFISRILLDLIGVVGIIYKHMRRSTLGDPKRLDKGIVVVFFCGPSILVRALWKVNQHVEKPTGHMDNVSCWSVTTKQTEGQQDIDVESAYISDHEEEVNIPLTRPANNGATKEPEAHKEACVRPDITWLVSFALDISITAAYIGGLVWNYLKEDDCYWNSLSFVFLMALVYLGCTACLTVGFVYLKMDKLRYAEAAHRKNKKEGRLQEWLKDVETEGQQLSGKARFNTARKPIEDFGQSIFYIGWKLESKSKKFCKLEPGQNCLKALGEKLRDLGIHLQHLVSVDDTLYEMAELMPRVTAFEKRLLQLGDTDNDQPEDPSLHEIHKEMTEKTCYPITDTVPKWIIWSISSLLEGIEKLVNLIKHQDGHEYDEFEERRKKYLKCIGKMKTLMDEEKEKGCWNELDCNFVELDNPAAKAWGLSNVTLIKAKKWWTEEKLEKRIEEHGQKLNLQDCGLTDIPEKVYTMAQAATIHVLELSGNFIHNLPKKLSQLGSLREVRVCCSEVHTIEPGALGEDIEVLGLEGNQLTCLDEDVLTCHKLRLLNLKNNDIRELPARVDLPELSGLHVRQNKLTKLPYDLVKCKNLKLLEVRDNSLTIPDEIIESGCESIQNYLVETQEGSTTRLPSLRIQILGEPGTGKSRFIDELCAKITELQEVKAKKVHNNMDNKADEIEHKTVRRFQWKTKNIVEFYEFNAHEFYQQAHGLVKSKTCASVICVRADRLKESNFAELVTPWFETCSTTPNATIHLVATYGDQCRTDELKGKLNMMVRKVLEYEFLVRRQLEKKIQLIKTKLEGDKTDEELKRQQKRLKRLLSQRPNLGLPTEAYAVSKEKKDKHDRINHVNLVAKSILAMLENWESKEMKTIPQKWSSFLKGIEESGKNLCYLTSKKVQDIAKHSKTQKKEFALKYFHLCGDLLWYRHDKELKDVIFHDPKTLLEVATVLMNLKRDIKPEKLLSHLCEEDFEEEKKRLEKGFISDHFLDCVWKRFEFSKKGNTPLKQLLLRLEICNEIPRMEDVSVKDLMCHWLLPEIPERETPEPERDFGDQTKIHIMLVFAGRAPPSYLPALVAQVSQETKYFEPEVRQYWKSRMSASDKEGNYFQVDLTHCATGDHILLTVCGPDRVKAWELALNVYKEMNKIRVRKCEREWVTFCVPCPKCQNNDEKQPCTFSADYLWTDCREDLLCKVQKAMVDKTLLYPQEKVLKEPAIAALIEKTNTGADLTEADQQQKYNYKRVFSLVAGYGPDVLREILRRAMQPLSLANWLQFNQPSVHQVLKGRPIETYAKLYPSSGRSPRFTDLDLDDLMDLIRCNVLNVPPPRTGWTIKDLDPYDYTLGANVLRLKETYAELNMLEDNDKFFSSKAFLEKWSTAEKIVLNLGGQYNRILQIKSGGLY